MMTGGQKNWCYLTNIGTISTPKLTAECLLMLLALFTRLASSTQDYAKHTIK